VLADTARSNAAAVLAVPIVHLTLALAKYLLQSETQENPQFAESKSVAIPASAYHMSNHSTYLHTVDTYETPLSLDIHHDSICHK